jgi:hypothetical protein
LVEARARLAQAVDDMAGVKAAVEVECAAMGAATAMAEAAAKEAVEDQVGCYLGSDPG